MFTHQLTKEVIKENVVEIMKAKNQWKQNQTTIQVQHFNLQICQVYLIEVNCISSTMILSQSWPKQLLKTGQLPAIFAFRADKQTNGRGQKSNNWQSPQGNLYMTLLIRIQFSYFPYLPIIAISNVFKTIKNYLKQQKAHSIVKIKWINDILVDFQKVSGVLIKNQMVGQLLFTQIGIGVNIKKLPQQNLIFNQPVTFLQKHLSSQISIKQFGLKLINQFVSSFYDKNLQKTKEQAKKVYEANLAYLNREVLLYDYKYEQILASGVFKGINEYGHAILEGCQHPFVEGRMKIHQSII